MGSESDSTWLRIESLVIVVLLVVGGVYLWPKLHDFIATSDAVDSGSRGLVLLASRGGGRPLTLNSIQKINADGTGSFTFSFTAKDVTYGESGNTVKIGYQIYFLGDRFSEGVRCQMAPASRKPADAATPGIVNAIKVDKQGGPNSALSYSQQASTAAPRRADSRVEDTGFMSSGSLWLLKNDIDYHERVKVSETSDESWSEQCTFGRKAIWNMPSGHKFESSPRRSLLPFQVNWTGMAKETDFQHDMRQEIVVERPSGTQLSEAYPQVDADARGWTSESSVYWVNKLGEAGNFAYTSQPVLIFTKRSSADTRALFLMWAGLGLGVGGSLLARLLFIVVRALYRWQAT